MLNHMMAYCQNTTWVLPYGRFLKKVFKEFSLDLKATIEIEKRSPFYTYTESSMGTMKFIKGDDSAWVRRVIPHSDVVDEDEDDDNDDTLAPY